MSDNLADEFGILREQKNNRIYGNAANQVLRSSSDDIANIRIFFKYFLLFYLITTVRRNFLRQGFNCLTSITYKAQNIFRLELRNFAVGTRSLRCFAIRSLGIRRRPARHVVMFRLILDKPPTTGLRNKSLASPTLQH